MRYFYYYDNPPAKDVYYKLYVCVWDILIIRV